MGQIRGITEKKIYKTSKRRVRVIYFKVGEIFLPSYLQSGITFAQVTHNFLKQYMTLEMFDPGNYTKLFKDSYFIKLMDDKSATLSQL